MDVRRIGAGVAGGLACGVVFGVLMHAMGMLPMVARLVGQETVGVGWAVHLANSAVIGALYGATFGQLPHDPARGAAFGAGYGLVWWVLGALLIMPLWLGMPAFQVGEMQLWSLVGHLLYGVTTGVVFAAVVRQAADRPATAS